MGLSAEGLVSYQLALNRAPRLCIAELVVDAKACSERCVVTAARKRSRKIVNYAVGSTDSTECNAVAKTLVARVDKALQRGALPRIIL